MMKKLNSLFNYLTHPTALIRRLRKLGTRQHDAVYKAMKYDADRYIAYAGVFNRETEENLIARIIHTYHGLEKGLTMPNRRLNFGHDAVRSLVMLIQEYLDRFHVPTAQVNHGIGILKAYLEMHHEYDGKSDYEFWSNIHSLTDRYPSINPATQLHTSADAFYAYVNSDFKNFAESRHTLRHYCGTVSEEEITKAVKLAMTAPSACNRQPVRVHCISDQRVKDEVLSMQSGNRGFGTDADKILIVTGDLSDICWIDERYDIYTNCGIFIMNLCYSLFFYKIAHCVLNWSICVNAEQDHRLHEIAGIPENEVVAAMLTCGKTPDEIDVASSPRREVSEILRFH